MGGTATLNDLLKEGKAKFEGDRKPFEVLRSAMKRFMPDFEMVPGTSPEGAKTPSTKKALEMDKPADSLGG